MTSWLQKGSAASNKRKSTNAKENEEDENTSKIRKEN